MFPQNSTSITDSTQTEKNKIISDTLCYTPNYNYDNYSSVVKNGSIELIKDYRNIKNWFIKFIFTPIDTLKIYEGTGFGTSLSKLRGQKTVNCLELVQIKKEIQDGAKLNPAIKEVTSIKLYKIDSNLIITINAELIDGITWTDEIEVVKFYD